MLRIFRGSSFRLPLWLAMSVDLCHHMLDLRVVLERVNGQVLAVAGLLEAAVRHLGDKRNVVVDPDGPELELPGHIPLVSEMPHGGFKESGYGKDLSVYSLEDYTQIKH